jgi:transcriptional regulator with XRE-family HTH domain
MPGSPTQAEFARICGISRNSVVRYEGNAQGADKPIVLMRWAQVTDFDYEWLTDGDMPSPNDPTTGDTSDNSGVNTIRYLLTPPLALTA